MKLSGMVKRREKMTKKEMAIEIVKAMYNVEEVKGLFLRSRMTRIYNKPIHDVVRGYEYAVGVQVPEA
jgi:hypothetical protein